MENKENAVSLELAAVRGTMIDALDERDETIARTALRLTSVAGADTEGVL